MKVGLVGPSYTQRSLPFDAQRTVNLFPVFDDQGKEVAALYGTPGKSFFGTAGSGPVRYGFVSSNGRMFVVSGNKLYEIVSSGAATELGTLLTDSGNVTIDENPTQLFVCDGENGYILTYATNAFAQVSDVHFPSAGTVTNINGYFVVNQNDTGKFFISALNDGTSWDALDFATAESSPDELRRVIRALDTLWLMGTKTTEPWTNTGDASFPFQKIAGAVMPVGIMAPHTALEFGGSLMWVGQDNNGSGMVYRAKGFTPQRISTEAIEILIGAATDKENMKAYAYQKDGHNFYVLTGGGLETSLVFDMTTNLWHERAYLNMQGNYEQDLASCCMFAFGEHYVGSRVDGKVFTLSLDIYSDDGAAIARDRIYTHISNEGERVRYNALEIGFETGVGLQTGQGSDPKALIKFSKDGGRTWSGWYEVEIGAIGEYQKKVVVRRIGIAEQLTIWVRVTDPVKVAMIGSYLN